MHNREFPHAEQSWATCSTTIPLSGCHVFNLTSVASSTLTAPTTVSGPLTTHQTCQHHVLIKRRAGLHAMPDDMPAIVGIHGIAQQYMSGPQLTAQWFDALKGGLEAAGDRARADALSPADLRVAFFGDLFRPPGSLSVGDTPYTAEDLNPGAEQELLGALYEAAIAQEPSLAPDGETLGPGMVTVQFMLSMLAKSKTFAGLVQELFIRDLKQVNNFLDNPKTKSRVLARVHEDVDGQTRVLIGHSLGSVVAYEYMCQHPDAKVDVLITLGSPLGIPNLIFNRLTPPPVDGTGAWPGAAHSWVNVADRDDVVALTKTLAGLFARPDGLVPRDRAVDNGDKPHAIDRYLNSQQVGDAVSTALGSS